MPSIETPSKLLSLVQENFRSAENKRDGWLTGLKSPVHTLDAIIAKLDSSASLEQKQKYMRMAYDKACESRPPYPEFYLDILNNLTQGNLDKAIRTYVIHLLQQRLDYNTFYEKKDRSKITPLQLLIDQLNQDTSNDWLATFKKTIQSDQALKKLVAQGNTGKLIQHIQKQDFTKAEKIITEQNPVPVSYFSPKIPVKAALQPAAIEVPPPAPKTDSEKTVKPSPPAKQPTVDQIASPAHQRTQHVFSVGDDIEDETTHLLSSHFYDANTEIVVENLHQGSQHEKLSGDQLKSLVCLGHANQDTYGNFSADEFVQKIATLVDKKDRAQLQDLYLVGCELGLRDDQGLSLAQSIADQLHKKGFEQVNLKNAFKI